MNIFQAVVPDSAFELNTWSFLWLSFIRDCAALDSAPQPRRYWFYPKLLPSGSVYRRDDAGLFSAIRSDQDRPFILTLLTRPFERRLDSFLYTLVPLSHPTRDWLGIPMKHQFQEWEGGPVFEGSIVTYTLHCIDRKEGDYQLYLFDETMEEPEQLTLEELRIE